MPALIRSQSCGSEERVSENCARIAQDLRKNCAELRAVHLAPLHRERPDAEHAVLGLQRDVDAGGDVVGDERRDPDPEVDVRAVEELVRRALDDLKEWWRR